MLGNLKIAWPPEFAWRCHLIPGVVYHLEEGKQPNAFHRLPSPHAAPMLWRQVGAD